MFVLCFLLFAPARPATILFTAPFSGSHLHYAASLATTLSNHTIYLATPERDAVLPDVDIRLITPQQEGMGFTTADRVRMGRECMREIVTNTPSHLTTPVYIGTDCRLDAWDNLLNLSRPFFSSLPSFLPSPPDLVICDDANIASGAGLAERYGVPLICNVPWNHPHRSHTPLTLLSTPTLFWPDLGTTGFSFIGLLGALRRWYFASVYSDEREGRSLERVDLFVVNEVGLFAPPYILPPDTVLIGGIHLRTKPPTPTTTSLPAPNSIYVSFGSYAIPELLPWLPTLLQTLSKTAREVLVKVNTLHSLPVIEGVTYKTWYPQVSLLASGRITLFVSHCGQNSRIEALAHGVPMFCIPLFGDQYFSAQLVAQAGFGEVLLKENVTENSVRETLELFEKDRPALTRAKELFWRSPDTKPDRFVYEVEKLLSFGREVKKEKRVVHSVSYLNMGLFLGTVCLFLALRG
eukprot:sb/3464460/